MGNWETLKTVIQSDLEAWDEFVSQLTTSLNNEKDVRNRKSLKGALAPLLVYQEVAKHYLEVIAEIEKGTFDLEEVVQDDGGSAEESD